MAEVSGSNTVPLRRARGARSTTVPANDGPTPVAASTWGAPLQSMLAPPRLLWLAGLGGTALTLRAARVLWSRLLLEGAATEGWLRTKLRRDAA